MTLILRLAPLLLLVTSLAACRMKRPRDVEVFVPKLNGEICAERIRVALAGAEGVQAKSMRFDFEARTVSLEFDSMKTATKNIEHIIARVGFDANTIPAYEEGLKTLPEECR